ncbi:Acyl dehydratase [Gordonia malaquae]|uniref:3-hydroxyacyl-thioester dehydratase HtdZ n=1 Tax=Gordonia malaquae NBRC 108250 TaxID=1223542 RepID=M3V079_GORML|nr:MaoC family dehydratase [Gordonia malaquae]GAC81787.1 3-hydroxyacyl-thioester dehydratase HtdZ [Gordonia malaquae NBRC 108250]SEB71547.1 Acyl dehydratase [Gordonia malaquae]
MKILNGKDELVAAVGSHLGYSDWVEVDQARIDMFAEATGDHQWIHVDPEKAAEGPFGTTIAHGFLTLSLIPMLSWQVYKVEGTKMGVNYGSNKVRFPSHVPVGSRLRAGVEIASVTETPAGHQVVARVTVEREGGEKPVCVAETVSVLVF